MKVHFRAIIGSMLVLALLGSASIASADKASRVRPRYLGGAKVGTSAKRGLPAMVPSRPDALSRALKTGVLSDAEYALERARSLFALGAVRDRFGAVNRPDPHMATLILRDLVLRK